jgi:hypothetical protein
MTINPPERIHLIFKTHLDLGYTELAKNVVTQYFTSYIPNVLRTARFLREQGSPDRFIWTTGSWLVYTYLEQASPSERALMEQAIEAGDLSWHGLPFTMHSELMDASLFRFGLSLSHILDARFGKQTIAAKLTDVPGHTRGIVPLLAEAGITFLHIGVNPASTAPAVPPIFVWRDTSGAEVIVMYQAGSYGDFGWVPGSPAGLAFAHTNDNLGPQSLEGVSQAYQQLRTRFPQAQVAASTLDAFARELVPLKELLPVVTAEIGDTWIHGVGTDPLKVSQFRELARLRRQWLQDGRLVEGEQRTTRFSLALLPVAEHTWGLDEKTFLDDYTKYPPAQLQELRKTERARYFAESWQEQRAYLQQALTALEDSPEAEEARAHLQALALQTPERASWQQVQDWSQRFETDHFTLGFDPHAGGLRYLRHQATGHQWASDEYPLGRVQYEVFSQSDYDRFWEQYVKTDEQTYVWALRDFCKPGIEQYITTHQSWNPRLTALYTRQDSQGISFLLDLCLPESCTALGAPRYLTLELTAPRDRPVIVLNLQWTEKQASRLPEALWCLFHPITGDPQGWSFSKLGTIITPLEVVSQGNRTLHAIDQDVVYAGKEGTFIIETLDAPLIAPGRPSLLDFPDQQPDLSGGIHCNLYNNVWGTNFPMWYEEDARFRFVLHFG